MNLYTIPPPLSCHNDDVDDDDDDNVDDNVDDDVDDDDDDNVDDVNIIWLASFDIGKKNFAFCIEEVDLNQLSKIPCEIPPLASRYYSDGTPTPNYQSILDHVERTGRIILIENIDLTYGTDPTLYLDPRVMVNMTRLLDSYMEYWQKCEVFLIEQQMNFGKNKTNTMALKLGQHCYSYFAIHFSSFKVTLEFPAYHKTKVMGAPRKMAKPQRKLWSIDRALTLLFTRNDHNTMHRFGESGKRDDMADVIMQLQAFKILVFLLDHLK